MVDLDQFAGSEIRRDYRTGYLSIIVPGRNKRPHEVKEEDLSGKSLENCPFEPGHEHMSMEIMRYGEPWQIRVIENKFPEFNPSTPLFSENRDKGVIKYIGGYGYNEVVIESPNHSALFEDLPIDRLIKWLEIIIERTDVLYTKRYIKHVNVFKNYGAGGGESIGHPHTQIMAYPLLAGNITKERRELKKYARENKTCLYEDIYKIEKSRMLTENDSFFAVAPFGSRLSAESMIVLKRHACYIGDLTQKERRDLVSILASVLLTNKKLYGKQSYNFSVHDLKTDPTFHLHVEIYPRMSILAGVELGEGLFVNTITPEDYADDFRKTAFNP